MRLPVPALVAAFAFSALAAVACSSPTTEEASVDEGQLVGTVRKGDEFTRCWTVSDGNADDFFRSYELRCRVSSRGLAGLAGSSVNVDAHGATGRVLSGRPGESVDTNVVLGAMTKRDFPIRLHIYGTWGTTPTSSITPFRIEVNAAESATAAAPAIVKLPFDVWPVTFLNRTAFAVVDATRYEAQAAPFFTERDERSTKTTFTASGSTGVMRGEVSASVDFIAPPSGAIAVTIQGRTPLRTTLDAPGVYVIEEAGLRLATAEEERAASAASAADAGADAASEGGATDAGAAPVTPPPPADAAPAPTCGDPGQQHCTSSNGAWSCNEGTRVDMNSGLCLACGNDGQTYCFIDPRNVSGAWKCNAGTRWDDPTSKCITCGTLGKTHCFADARNISGNWTCNAGLRYDSNGVCIAQ